MSGRYAWNPETCEEEILIAAYDEICQFIPADQTWKAEFENHFFTIMEMVLRLKLLMRSMQFGGGADLA
jgi:hypothetical protein